LLHHQKKFPLTNKN